MEGCLVHKRGVLAASFEAEPYLHGGQRDAHKQRQIRDHDVADATAVETDNVDCNSIHHGVDKYLLRLYSRI